MSVIFGNYHSMSTLVAMEMEARIAVSTELSGAMLNALREQARSFRRMTPVDYIRVMDGKVRSDDRITQVRYDSVREYALSDPNVYQAAEAEARWHKASSPTYKIYPDYCRMFEHTKLNIPASFIKMPHDSFVILFPEGMYGYTDGDNERADILSLLVSILDLEGDYRRRLLSMFNSSDDSQISNVSIMVLNAIIRVKGNITNYQFPIPISGLAPDDTMIDDMVDTVWTLQHATAKAEQNAPHRFTESTLEMHKMMTRMALSVAFLATGQDKLIEPDVINKHMAAYLEACRRGDDKTIQDLGDKSDKVRGAVSRAIGKREHLFGVRYKVGGPDEKDDKPSTGEGGRELEYRHVRNPHFHAYRTGAGRKETVVKFVRMVVVRPDLPARPDEQRAYRTPTRLPAAKEKTDVDPQP